MQMGIPSLPVPAVGCCWPMEVELGEGKQAPSGALPAGTFSMDDGRGDTPEERPGGWPERSYV